MLGFGIWICVDSRDADSMLGSSSADPSVIHELI